MAYRRLGLVKTKQIITEHMYEKIFITVLILLALAVGLNYAD